jgi:hypothetical protein
MEAEMPSHTRTLSVRLSIVAMVAAGAGASSAHAQETGARRILTPEETRQCVCMSDEIEAARVRLEPLEQEFNRLNELVENARPHVDTRDRAEVESFRNIYLRREALRQQLQDERRALIGDIIGPYNAQCASQIMMKLNVDAVRADRDSCARRPGSS